jgi:hypothetical protein
MVARAILEDIEWGRFCGAALKGSKHASSSATRASRDLTRLETVAVSYGVICKFAESYVSMVGYGTFVELADALQGQSPDNSRLLVCRLYMLDT